MAYFVFNFLLIMIISHVGLLLILGATELWIWLWIWVYRELC